MKNPLPLQLAEVAPIRRVTHRLQSTSSRAQGILIITGYDYFLHKREYKSLLKQYREIILVPRSVDNDYLLNYTIRPLLARHKRIHLVSNPQYDQQHRIVYELVVRESKSIRVSTTEAFCQQYLGKLYIPQSSEEVLLTEPLASLNPATSLIKRGLDVLVAGSLLVASSPVWAWSALQIRRQSPGPVFYRQSRVGTHQQDFSCLKFRSMRLDAEALGAQFSSKHDKRTFPYGALMRSLRVDELPQLVNVLRGEMSLIGPRPERRVFTQSFEEVIPHYAERHVVKPGITGYAQIRYPYGVGAQDARHKLMYDLYYIKHWSPTLELRILWETVVTVITKKGC